MKVAVITGEIFNHRLLWMAAESLRDRGRKQDDGSSYQFLASLAFIYFSFEAHLNDLGARVAEDLWANERAAFSQGENRGTLGKLHVLATRLDVPVDNSRRPYQTVVELDRRRDAMVHSRTEVVEHRIRYRDPAKVPYRKDPDLFQFAEDGFLDRAFEDVESLCDSLQAAAQKKLGDHEILSPRAFKGIMWHQGGTL